MGHCGVISFLLLQLAVAITEASQQRTLQGLRRQLLADPEGASLTGIDLYIKWVQAKCGDPAKVTTGPCLALKTQLCGTRDTSQVLCFSRPGPVASFRSASRYTRIEYLVCSLVKLSCTTSAQAAGAGKFVPRNVDPVSLAAWQEYTTKCHGSNFNPKVTSAAVCANLSGAHCSRPDVKCGADAVEFFDLTAPTTSGAARKPVLRAVYNRGLFWVLD